MKRTCGSNGLGIACSPVVLACTAVAALWVAACGDAGDGQPPATATWYQDADEDGYGNPAKSVTADVTAQPAGYVGNDSDCDDADAAVHPGATEATNGKDDNCNGLTDESGADTPLTIDATGAVQSTVTITAPGGTKLVLTRGTRIGLIADGGDVGLPATTDKVELFLSEGTDGPALPKEVTLLVRFQIGITVNGVPKHALFLAGTGEGEQGLVAKIQVPAGSVPDGAIALLYDVTSGKALQVASATIVEASTPSTLIAEGAAASALEPSGGQASLPVGSDGSFAGGGAGGGSGGGGSGKFSATYDVADPGCIDVGGVQVCGPVLVDRIEVSEESTAEILGMCLFGASDSATTGALAAGAQFWCTRASAAGGGATVVVSSNQANLPLIHAYLVRAEDGLPMFETYVHASGGLGGPGGASYPDPYGNKDFEFAGYKQLTFHSKTKKYDEMRKHALQPLLDAGYEANQKWFEKTADGYTMQIDVYDTLDGRVKLHEDVLAKEKWKVRADGTQGNKGAFEDSERYRGTVKAYMNFPGSGTMKVWEVVANPIFTLDSASGQEGYRVFKTTGGTLTQTVWTVPLPGGTCKGEPEKYEDTYEIAARDGVLYVSTGDGDTVEYQAGASISDEPVQDKPYQMCCVGVPCESDTLKAGAQQHEWLDTGKDRRKAGPDGSLQGTYTSPLNNAVFEWNLTPDTGGQ